MNLQSIVAQLKRSNQTLSTTQILHSLVIRNSLSQDPFYATNIVRLYAVNDDLSSAVKVFDETPERCIYLWNSIIRAYARAHKFYDAFALFKRLLCSQTLPDNYTLSCVARACADNFDSERLKLLHGKVLVFGFGFDFVCNSTLVSCYSKLRLVEEAYRVFSGILEPDLVLCNAMVSCYGSCGDFRSSMELFSAMRSHDVRPDGYTMVGLIMGLSSDQYSIGIGETIHGLCVKYGLVSNDHVGSALLSMYSRLNCMDSALNVFDSLTQHDLVTWSALISAFSQSGDHFKGLTLFRELLVKGQKADSTLLASMLSASAQLAILRPGREIHCYALRRMCEKEITISSALTDMYAKCGFLETAIRVNNGMCKRNTVSYNTMISSLAVYGRASEAFRAFEDMVKEGVRPDEATFSSLLCACCHSGLLNEAKEYYVRMEKEFAIKANAEHHVYLVKLLGMKGKFYEAYDHIKSLEEPVDSSIWGALLCSCDLHKDYELLKAVSKHLHENESKNSSYKVMLSNLFAADGRWDDVNRLRVGHGGIVGKMPGISWISDAKHRL